jgi:hypothetical protein
MGKLAIELRKRFKTPQECLAKLGLDSSLLDDEWSTKAKARKAAARRGMTIDEMPDPDAELRAARDLSGEEFERFQRRHDDKVREAVMADDDEEDDMVKDWRDEIPAVLEEMMAKHGRRQTMDRFSRFLSDKAGWSHDQIGEMLRSWPMPKSAIEGGMGGRLAEDDEERAALDEDIDTVMERLARDWSERDLEGVGGTATSAYLHDPAFAKDRRRMAKDRKLANDAFGLDRLEGRGSDFANFGDREPPALAYDERSSDAAAEVDAWFGTGRIRAG